jgi:Uma2 family endonuclease
MTVTMEKPQALDELLDSLELPPGYKAETTEGQITVTPPPNDEHESVFAELTYQLNVKGWRVSGNSGLITPLGHFIPDLTVARKEYFTATSGTSWRNPEGVALVAEITSSNPSADRDGKRRGYATVGIPLYLLVDREAKQTILFSAPARGDYRTISSRPITEQIDLPVPFGFSLEDIV